MEYIVTRDQGYPVDSPIYKQLEVIELDEAAAKDGVDAGYLLEVNPESRAFTEDMAKSVAEFRQKKAASEAAAKQNETPEVPVDAEKVRAGIAKAETERRANVAKILATGPVKAGAVISQSADGSGSVTALVDQVVVTNDDGQIIGLPASVAYDEKPASSDEETQSTRRKGR